MLKKSIVMLVIVTSLLNPSLKADPLCDEALRAADQVIAEQDEAIRRLKEQVSELQSVPPPSPSTPAWIWILGGAFVGATAVQILK